MTDPRDATTSQPQSTSPVGDMQTPSSNNPTPSSPNQNAFLGMALSMSWQLAVVVLVPILGGHIMDSYFKTEPWITLGGLAVAAIGVFGVLAKVVADADAQAANSGSRKGTK